MNTHKKGVSVSCRRDFPKLINHLKKTRAGQKKRDFLNVRFQATKYQDSVLVDIQVCNMGMVKIVNLTYTVCDNPLETAYLHQHYKYSVLEN